jgi:aspartyl-tRNA synthetase
MTGLRTSFSFALFTKPFGTVAACCFTSSFQGQQIAAIRRTLLGCWRATCNRRSSNGRVLPFLVVHKLPYASRRSAAGDLSSSLHLSATLPPSRVDTSLRTHPCGVFRSEHVGCRVTICGWAHTIRDRGGVTFLLVRDRYGIIQVTIDASGSETLRAQLKLVRRESVVRVCGTIRARDQANVNTAMPTGCVELIADSLEVLSRADPLPLALEMERSETGPSAASNAPAGPSSNTGASEETRLRYRYLDLRRAPLQLALIRRHQVAMAVRRVLDGLGFVEVETPILTRATPEGARDYLVPSRVHRGKWYALPQSPQLYKQLLMVGGLDRYFQIARCFRDEDLRQDRQPEFTQVDLEMSFVRAIDVMQAVERVAEALFPETLSEQCSAGSEAAVDQIAKPETLRFPILTYETSMERFGTDAPDLRFGLELQCVWSVKAADEQGTSAIFFRALNALAPLGDAESIRAIVIPEAAPNTSRKTIDLYIQFVKNLGLSGLLWGKVGAADGKRAFTGGPLAKLESTVMQSLLEHLDAHPTSIVLVAAGADSTLLGALGRLRVKIARERGLVDDSEFRFCWVTEFPLFAWDDEANRLTCVHHPFTAPREDQRNLLISLVQRMQEEPQPTSRDAAIIEQLVCLRSEAYDLVCNGTEIGGGSIRIHDHELQRHVLRALNLSETDQEAKFGFLLEALRYGAPPHGGFAFGLDRCVMMACRQAQSLRDVIAFPKTTSASELMTGAPSTVEDQQLTELSISVTMPKERLDEQTQDPAARPGPMHPSRV